MNREPLLGVKPAWWLAGGCLLLVTCLIITSMGAALGWLVLGKHRAAGDSDRASAEVSTSEAPEPLRGNAVGQIAPEFTLLDADGQSFTLNQLRGRPLLINFWATWCAPCRAEMPALEAAYQDHKKDGLVVIAIDVQENPELAQTFAKWLGVTFSVLDDGDGSVARQYRVRALPTSFFVDRDGVIQAKQSGAMDRSLIETYVLKILH